MADSFATDFDELIPQGGQRPEFDLLGQHRLLLMMLWTASTTGDTTVPNCFWL
jgi:hypothetical protein